MSSSARNARSARGPARARGALLCAATGLTLLLAGCSREAPDVREVRKAADGYLRALVRGNEKEIADRSSCLASRNSLVGARVLEIEPPLRVRMGTLDSLITVSMVRHRSADSLWAGARDETADSLFRESRRLSFRSVVYRNAVRAIPLSAPGALMASDSTLETRVVRARFRYQNPDAGPQAVDREGIVRMLRAPGGKWIAFSAYIVEDDPAPEML